MDSASRESSIIDDLDIENEIKKYEIAKELRELIIKKEFSLANWCRYVFMLFVFLWGVGCAIITIVWCLFFDLINIAVNEWDESIESGCSNDINEYIENEWDNIDVSDQTWLNYNATQNAIAGLVDVYYDAYSPASVYDSWGDVTTSERFILTLVNSYILGLFLWDPLIQLAFTIKNYKGVSKMFNEIEMNKNTPNKIDKESLTQQALFAGHLDVLSIFAKHDDDNSSEEEGKGNSNGTKETANNAVISDVTSGASSSGASSSGNADAGDAGTGDADSGGERAAVTNENLMHDRIDYRGDYTEYNEYAIPAVTIGNINSIFSETIDEADDEDDEDDAADADDEDDTDVARKFGDMDNNGRETEDAAAEAQAAPETESNNEESKNTSTVSLDNINDGKDEDKYNTHMNITSNVIKNETVAIDKYISDDTRFNTLGSVYSVYNYDNNEKTLAIVEQTLTTKAKKRKKTIMSKRMKKNKFSVMVKDARFDSYWANIESRSDSRSDSNRSRSNTISRSQMSDASHSNSISNSRANQPDPFIYDKSQGDVYANI